MRFLSLFSGIEAASVAWLPLGWEPVAFAEVEPFACELLAARYPNVPNLGDVTKITEEQIAALGPFSVVVGGSPCQDLSRAGTREGLVGKRSALFLDQVRVWNYAREHCGARFVIWENVVGALQRNRGRDFAFVVNALANARVVAPVDGWGREGVALGNDGLLEWSVLNAQWFNLAQRRERLFACLDVGEWASRPPVLVIGDRLRGNTAPRHAGPAQVVARIGGRSRAFALPSVAGTICAESHPGSYSGQDAYSGRLIPAPFPLRPDEGEELVCDGCGCYWVPDGALECCPVCGARQTWLDFLGLAEDFPAGVGIRRLTPTEVERLFGFPDGYTAIPYKGKPAPESLRYHALGNSIAVPVLHWIGKQIDEAVKYANR